MRATLRWAHSDLRTHRGEALFLVLATAGIVISLLLAGALFGYATNPWQRVFSQTHGAHVWIHTGTSTDLGKLTTVDGIEAVAGPYATAATTLTAPGTRASVELRATPSAPSVGRPLLTAGHWLDPRTPEGVVLESRLARALLAGPGDTLSLPDGTGKVTVVGVADTAEARYRPGEQPGLVWVLPAALRHPTGQIIGLRLVDPAETDYAVQRAVTALGAGAIGEVSTWQQARAEAQGDNRLLGQVLGLFGFGALIAAGFAVHGAIATRIRGHLRDISVLKAIGFTPSQLVRVFLSQHIAYALLGAVGAVTVTDALGGRVPGRLGDAVRLWQVLPGHTLTQFAVPAGAVLFIAATTGLAAWRAGRVPPVPRGRPAGAHEAHEPRAERIASGKRLPALMRRALEIRVPAPLVLGLHGTLTRPARSLATVARLTLPLLLIVVAMSAWTTLDRLHRDPERIGVPAALTVRAHGGPGDQDLRALLERDPQVVSAYPGVEVAALVPGQTTTIALRGLGSSRSLPLHRRRRTRGARERRSRRRSGSPRPAERARGRLGPHDGRRPAPDPAHRGPRHRTGERGPRHLHLARHSSRQRPASHPDPLPAPSATRRRPEHRRTPADRSRTGPAGRTCRGQPGRRAVPAARGRGGPHPRTGPDRTRRGADGDRRHRPRGRARPAGLESHRHVPRQITAVTMTAMGCTALAAFAAAAALGTPAARWLIDTQGRSSGIGAGIAQDPPVLLLVLFGAATSLGAAGLAALPAARAARRRLADTLAAA